MPVGPRRVVRYVPWGRIILLAQAVRKAWERLTPAERRRAGELIRKLTRERRLARAELHELRRMATKGAGL